MHKLSKQEQEFDQQIKQAKDELVLFRERAQEHEQSLLVACVKLINSKKRKIRQLHGDSTAHETESVDKAQSESESDKDDVSSVAASDIRPKSESSRHSSEADIPEAQDNDSTTSDEEL